MSQPIDPDLPALRTTIDSLIEGGDGYVQGDADNLTVESVGEIVLGLKARTERLLRSRLTPSSSELEELLTESSGLSYTLEAQRLRAKRRMVAALADASGSTPREIRELSSRYRRIMEELEWLEAVNAGVRAQLEKARRA